MIYPRSDSEVRPFRPRFMERTGLKFGDVVQEFDQVGRQRGFDATGPEFVDRSYQVRW